jgi:crotonobetainyl-CoA:carnitine CoA-transferase CaiB-like acyl-CoA transferase
MSALTAIFWRLASGEGQFIDVSMHQASNVTTEAASYSWLVARQTVQRQTGRHAAIMPSGETQMRCQDGRWVNTGVPPRSPADYGAILSWVRELGLEEDFPDAVFLEMGANLPGLLTYDRIGIDAEATAIFMAGRDALALIAANVSAYDYFIGCQRRGVAVGVIYSPEEAFEDEHFIARGFQVPVEHADLGRTFRYPGAPYRMTGSPWAIQRRAPKLGEHNAEVLGETSTEAERTPG